MYSVNEGSEQLKLALSLTKPSSIDITLQVTVTAVGTATGELTDDINTSDMYSSYSRG